MVSAFAASFAALFLAMTSLELFSFLESQSGACTTTTSAHQAPLVDTAAAEVLPAAAAGALFIAAIAFMYHRLSRHPAAVPVAGGAANNRRLPGLVTFILCVSTGMLEYILFVRTAAGGGAADHGAQAARRALGLAARHALPAAATATFFLGMALVIVAHVRAGGEGGGGAVAGDEPVRAAVRVLTRIAVGAAAGLTFLMGMAFFYNPK